MRLTKPLIGTALILSVAVAQAQADPAMLQKIVDEGKNRSQAYATLTYITKEIGARLTASGNLSKAYVYALDKFEKAGLSNVHLEQWGEWPVGFDRGPCSGGMVSPEKASFEFTTPSWTEGTHGKQRGIVVAAPKTKAEFEKVKDSLKGAWVYYEGGLPRPPRGRRGEAAPEPTPELKARLDLEADIETSGLLGRIVPSQNELTITSGNYNVTMENHPMVPQVIIRKSDSDKIKGYMSQGKPVELEFDINQRFIPGPRKIFNVVAELPGTEKPDEVVIMGGHLDSWDGPGSEGAADNGNGSATTLEAARILAACGVKPKRTIRFILFTGEEQGLFGSRAYVEQHKDEMDKISCVFIEDGGANYEGGTYALASMVPMFDPLMALMNKAFPNMPVKMRTVDAMPRGGGSDHVPFNGVGVPGFFWDEVGPVNYTHVHHTQYDRLELVPEKYLVQSAVNSAAALLIMADAPTLMPRAPKPDPAAGGN